MKRVLLTGATSGIGKEIAAEVLRRGDCLLLVCRSQTRAAHSIQEWRAMFPHANIEVYFADLAEMKQVRAVALQIQEKHSNLDILVNNAGLYLDRRLLTEEGYEKTFAVNHLSYMALTQFLTPLLRQSKSARIVNVASRAHRYGSLLLDDLMWSRPYRPRIVYGTTKLCNILFSSALVRRLEGSGISVNSLHPGVVRTRFAKGQGGVMGWGTALLRPFFLSPKGGAETPLFLMYSSKVEGCSGGYYVRCKKKRPSKTACDMMLAERLWEESEALIQRALMS